MNESGYSVLRLSWRNVIRWRWRLLTIAVLIGLTCSLYLLYGGLIISSTSSGIARIQPIELDYFDLLVLLDEEQPIPEANLPRARYGQHLLESQEVTLTVDLATPYGSLRALGLPADSACFRAPDDLLLGRLPQSAKEIALPQRWAEKMGLSIGQNIAVSYLGQKGIFTVEVSIVGMLAEDAYPLALLPQDTLAELASERRDNSILMSYPRSEATLEQLVTWMTGIYPKATLISTSLPLQLGQNMLEQAYRPARFIVFMLFLFMGVGVTTIALMTFLERRTELATLKAVGISNRQTILLFGAEYSLTEVIGLVVTAFASVVLLRQVPWFSDIGFAQQGFLVMRGCIFALIALVIALLYPILIAKAATVNQLLYARTIPLVINEISMLPKPTGDMVLREIEENIRFLRVPYDLQVNVYTCMLFKSVGQPVKMGEAVASDEIYNGHVVNNYRSICDGTILELHGPIVVIKPDSPDAPRHPYPDYLIEDEKRRRERFESYRADERELIEEGTSSHDMKLRYFWWEKKPGKK